MSVQENPVVSGAPFEELPQVVPGGAASSLDALLDVSMPVVIEIGRAQMTVQEVLQLSPGSVVQLDRSVGEPVDIYVSDRRLAQGEVVVVGDHFGVRITRVLSNSTGESGA
jgi:flagellar motor switch protein FliN/FliY